MAGLDNDPGEMLFVLNPEFVKQLEQGLNKKQEKFFQDWHEAVTTGNEKQFFETKSESHRKEKYRLQEKENQRLGYIYDIKTLVKNLKIKEKSIRNLIHKDQEKDFYSRNFAIWKSGTRILFEKEKLHKFISKNSYKYENGIKISPLKYSRLPEYLTINDCAEKLGLKDGRQFRRNYIDNNPARLEGVEILKIGSTVRIEQESFLRYVETLGGETAK